MLARETDEAFDDKDWIYEIKWDGYRAIADLTKESVQLYSRNGNNFVDNYPVVVNALKKLKHAAVLDGEIVVLNEDGFPDFQKIQHYGENPEFPIQYYVFDLLALNGHALDGHPLIERKELLKELVGDNPIIKFSDHIAGNGKDFFDAAIQKNLEGIMAKKADSHYYPGHRTNDWLKIKNHKTADVLIAGYSRPTGSRKFFGSLVLAIKDGDILKHAGHAGTGYNDAMLEDVFTRLQPYILDSSPFKEKVDVNAGVTWVKPVLVCEVKFTEWTKDGKLRHPVFLRLRNDKSVKEVDMKNIAPVKPAAKKVVKSEKEQVIKKAPGKKIADVQPPAKRQKKEKENEGDLKIGKLTVKITNRSKLYWPDEGITKGMMIDYYQTVADYILPYLKDRPQSLKRNPNGIKDQGFFHKDAGEEAPSFVKSFKVHSDSTNKKIDYIICNDRATLAYLNNLGCIELNPWHSTMKTPDKPDYMIIDIDPSEKNTFNQVIDSALHFKDLLDKAGVQSFCKTSGSSGLHIYVPMGKKYDYDQVKDFAQLLCMIVSEELPSFTTIERNLKKRGNNMIYLDFLQNRRSQTISSVYSLRPRAGATVSMPLHWKEVRDGLLPSDFTIYNAPGIIKKKGDIFSGVLGPGINLSATLGKLGLK